MAARVLLKRCVSLRFSREQLNKEDKSLRHTVTTLTTQLASVTKENKDNEIDLPGLLVSYGTGAVFSRLKVLCPTIHLVLLPCRYGCFSAAGRT